MRKMKKVLRLAVAFVALFGVQMNTVAQSTSLRVPDNDDILVRTIDANSPYYIDRLLAKYYAAEEPLTDEEYFYLYYGFAYSEAYRPLEPNPADNLVMTIVEEVMGNPTEEAMLRLVDAALQVMERDPFSPKNLNLLAFAYGSLGDSENERKCYDRLEGILRTIEKSGTGETEDSPKHVLMFSHAADVIYARGLEIKSREVISRSCEYIFLPMRDDEGNLGYYFDFSRVYWVKSDVPQEPQKRGWTINNMPLKTKE